VEHLLNSLPLHPLYPFLSLLYLLLPFRYHQSRYNPPVAEKPRLLQESL
jgi:hypothetical protein